MHTTLAIGPDWLHPVTLIESLGGFALAGIMLVIFAECGLLLGFFLPGDSLLFTAGLLVATGSLDLPLWLLCVLVTAAAILGNLVGYWIGWRVGPALFRREDSRFFKQEYVDKTHAFFEKHGARAIVLARFVPIVRTFITAIAGVGRMDFRVYALYSSIGGVLWGTGLTVAGFYLGKFEFIRDHIELMLVLIVALSVLPMIFEVIRSRRRRGTTLDEPAATSVPD